MQIFVTAAPDQLHEAGRYTRRLAHAAYRVGPEGRLLRRNQLSRARGGLMVLDDGDCGPIQDRDALCREVWRECVSRGFFGATADFERPVSQDRLAFLLSLSQLFARGGRRLYVPEAYGPRLPLAHVLICTALSGGSLRRRLEEAAGRFGPGRLALDLQRLRMDFLLPSPTGEGTPLSQEELDALLEQIRPSVFYSRELCARYFTYSRDGVYHFVLYDDGGTLRQKLRFGRSLGCAAAFLMYPEAKDLLGELLS